MKTSLPMSASGMNPQATPKIERNLTLKLPLLKTQVAVTWNATANYYYCHHHCHHDHDLCHHDHDRHHHEHHHAPGLPRLALNVVNWPRLTLQNVQAGNFHLNMFQISNVKFRLNLVVKMFGHLMQKTAVDRIPTAPRHQTQGQNFPDLTFQSFDKAGKIYSKNSFIGREKKRIKKAPYPSPL